MLPPIPLTRNHGQEEIVGYITLHDDTLVELLTKGGQLILSPTRVIRDGKEHRLIALTLVDIPKVEASDEGDPFAPRGFDVTIEEASVVDRIARHRLEDYIHLKGDSNGP